jgi:hypothetical protein
MIGRRTRSRRDRAARALAGIIAVASVQLIASGSARAAMKTCEDPVPSGSDSVVTCTDLGGPEIFTVPDGVTTVEVDAKGAAGGASGGVAGGQGGEESGSLSVTPGEILTVVVGGQGNGPTGTAGGDGGDGGGGGGGTGATGNAGGAGGGGGSFVFDDSGDLVVAAGGGGGSGNGTCSTTDPVDGGVGGGDIGDAGGCNEGGHGATQSGPGAGGADSGGSTDGTIGSGPAEGDDPGAGGGGGSADFGGGGGGGGYYGGGGGADDNGGGGGSGFDGGLTHPNTPITGDNDGDGVVTFTYATPAAPAITSSDAAALPVGQEGSFTVTTSGSPAPTISDGGATLPSGVEFTDNGNGTATVGGTPATSAAGVYHFTLTASNGLTPDATQPFTLYIPPPCPAAVLSGTEMVATCAYDDNLQTFTIPSGVNSVTLTVDGAQGGDSNTVSSDGGLGGEGLAEFGVTGGETLTILAGGAGNSPPSLTAGGGGGFGGGGGGGSAGTAAAGGGGGSFVVGPTGGLLLVAGGGGGGAGGVATGGGGGAGFLRGTSGAGTNPGGAASQTGGGAAGTVTASTGNGPAAAAAGAIFSGPGGNGSPGPVDAVAGAGGGGGYFGGGGGGGGSEAGGGGGGSGTASSIANNTTFSPGVHSGNGVVTITYVPAPPTASITSPSTGSVYALGQVVATSFSCRDSGGGPGLSSCKDGNGSTSPGQLSTSTIGTHTYTVTATSSDGQTATAHVTYTVLGKQTLTVTTQGAGTGKVTSSPAGITCPATCAATYAALTKVTLTAIASSGSEFSGWQGAGCSGLAKCTVSMSAARHVYATFAVAPPTCTLKLSSVRVPLPAKGKPAKAGSLKLTTLCDEAGALSLVGTLSDRPKGDGVAKRFSLGPVRATAKAHRATTLTIAVPKAAVGALAKGAMESVTLTVTMTNVHGRGHATTTIKQLHGSGSV